MKTCDGCKHADWNRTATGRLSPTGDGRCTFVVKLPPLPASMYWRGAPQVGGGFINRREPLKDHCLYFARIIK